MNLVALGFGYSLRHSLPQLAPLAGRITGTTRKAGKAERMRARGITPIITEGDAWQDALVDALGEASHVIVGAGPGRAGDPFLPVVDAAVRSGRARRLEWVGYLSTIGVYGDTGGAWVDDTSPASSTSQRGRERRMVEEEWTSLGARAGVPVALLRLGGIYGPGRNAFVNLARGTARRILRDGQVFNRIHVEDIGRVLAAAAQIRAGGVFNVTDGDPTPAEEPILFAAGLMGVDPPPAIRFEDAEFSPMARSFWDDNRRVASRRLTSELGVALRYPTYREGLGALWTSGTWRGDDEDREEASPRFRSG